MDLFHSQSLCYVINIYIYIYEQLLFRKKERRKEEKKMNENKVVKINKQTNKEARKQANKQKHKQTNKQIIYHKNLINFFKMQILTPGMMTSSISLNMFSQFSPVCGADSGTRWRMYPGDTSGKTRRDRMFFR